MVVSSHGKREDDNMLLSRMLRKNVQSQYKLRQDENKKQKKVNAALTKDLQESSDVLKTLLETLSK